MNLGRRMLFILLISLSTVVVSAQTAGQNIRSTQIDVAQVAPGTSDLYEATMAALKSCATPPCTFDYRGMGRNLTLSQGLDITWPGIFIFPVGATITKSADDYKPMFIIDRMEIKGGPVMFLGNGATLANRTMNDTIAVRDDDMSAGSFRIENMTLTHGSFGACTFGSEIDADAGLPTTQNVQLQVSNVGGTAGRFGIRTTLGYFNDFRDLRFIGCQGFANEGGDFSVERLYTDFPGGGNGWTGGSRWMGHQFVAGVMYQNHALVLPRSLTNGFVFAAQNTGVAGPPPAWCSTPNCTVTSGAVTFKAVGTMAWEWWPNTVYPRGALVTTYTVPGGASRIWQTTEGGKSCNMVPAWDFTASSATTEKGRNCGISWTLTPATNLYFNTPPASVTASEIQLEENIAGSGLALAYGSGNYTFQNLIVSYYTGWGIFNDNGGPRLTLLGGSVSADHDHPSLGGIYVGRAAGPTIAINLNFTGSGSGVGIMAPDCGSSVATQLTRIMSEAAGWATNESYPAGCSTGSWPASYVGYRGVHTAGTTEMGQFTARSLTELARQLPPAKNAMAWVTDGSSTSDCTNGGGGHNVLCVYTGRGWTGIYGY